MNIFAIAAAFIALTSGVALASDPVKVSDPVKADRSGFYAGGSIGSSTDNKSRIDLGMNTGYQFGANIRAEVDYDHAWKTNGTGNMVMVNAIGQYRIPNSTVTPYVLAGAGYGFDGLGSVKNGGQKALYDVGAGVRIAVSESVELDARYRNVRPVSDVKASVKEGHMFSVGTNYRF